MSRALALLLGVLLAGCAGGAGAEPDSPGDSEPPDSLLARYVADGPSFEVSAVRTNLSGITYNYDTGTHFLIENNGARVYEYSADLETPIRRLQLVGAHSPDFEGIAYLGRSQFAVANEINHVVVFSLPPDASDEVSLDSSQPGVQEFVLPPRGRWNSGLESLCFDPNGGGGGGTFYTFQEKSPRRLFRFDRPAHEEDLGYEDGSLEFDHPFDAEAVFDGVAKDISGCEFDARTGRLLAVSHQSSKIVEVTLAGEIVAELKLPGVFRGGAFQYEGVALDREYSLFVVSEPLFGTWPSRAKVYRFGSPSSSSPAE